MQMISKYDNSRTRLNFGFNSSAQLLYKLCLLQKDVFECELIWESHRKLGAHF